jgi:hypothetical protein
MIKKLIGFSIASTALLSGCGSVSTTLSSLARSTSGTYVNAYNGISNAPVSYNGYPYSVPNDLRVLSPKSLRSAIVNTKDAFIGSTYVGTNLTKNQRMAVYTAKMYLLYRAVLVLPQYFATTGFYASENKAIRAELPKVFSVIYGSTVKARKFLSRYELDKDNPVTVTGANTIVPVVLGLKTFSFRQYSVLINVPAGTVRVYENGLGHAPQTGGYTFIVSLTPKLGNFSHLWPVSNIRSRYS